VLRQSISDTLHAALEVGRHASAAQERALWSDFRARLEKKEEA
jgi:hypothetical protein